MKKINVKLWSMALIAMLAMIQSVSGQTQKALAAPIPEDVNKIFKNSCTPCHWDGGKMMAMGMVNFTKWTEYTSSKGASKASMICSVLNKGKMPPKKVRKEMPEIVPSKDQLDLICKWADSLRAEKKNP
jgi:cytochrome c5